MLFSEKLVIAKIETTEGENSSPVLSTDLIRTLNAEIEPLVVNATELNVDQPGGGNFQQRQRAKRIGMTLPWLATPSGTAGDAPEGAVLLRSCGLAEVITPTTDVVYSPVTTGFETCSAAYNQSGNLHLSLGFKGNLTMQFTQGEDPLFTATGEGSYSDPTAAPIGVPDFSGFQAPLEVNEANTSITIAGVEFDVESFSFDAGLPQTFISRTMQTGMKTGDPKPSGSMVVTAPTLATRNFIKDVADETIVPIVLTHGTEAGSIIQLDIFACQLMNPSYSESEGDLMISFDLNPLRNASSQTWQLTYK